MKLRNLVLLKLNPKKDPMNGSEALEWTIELPRMAEAALEQIAIYARMGYAGAYGERRIELLQRECIYLLDTIHRYDLSIECEIDLRTLCVECLQDILIGLFTEYPDQVLMDIKMPITQFSNGKAMFKNQMELMETEFKRIGVEQDLQSSIKVEFIRFLSMKTSTYQTADFFSQILDGIIDLFHPNSTANIDNRLLEFLTVMGFNSVNMANCYIKVIMATATAMPDVYDQIDFLQRRLEHFQFPPFKKKKCRLNFNQISCVEMVHNKIDVELHCLKQREKRERPAAPPAAAPQGFTAPYQQGSYKIRFTLSVDVLAYMIKLMVATDLIEPGVKTELMRCVAGMFQTPGSGAGGIAPGSFQTRYKNVVQSTAVSTKTILSKMMKEIDKEFF